MIEMLVSIAIIGILLGIAQPSYSTFMENSKIRNVASSFQTGIQTARTNAVAFNTPVVFAPTATMWSVSVSNAALCPIAGVPNCPMIVGHAASAPELATIQINGSGNLAFNGLGQNTSGLMTINFQSTSGSCLASGGEIRCLNVIVTPGGHVRVCDPAVSANDTRHC